LLEHLNGPGYGLDDKGSIPGRGGERIFFFVTVSRPVVRPTKPPIQWVPGTLSLGVKRPGRESDHSPPSITEVKECLELYLYSHIHLHGVVLY
jgi:hypothetical protein